MQEPMFLKPVFQEKIWGGSRLRSVFGFDIPNDKIGEDWAISAHPHGVSVVENGEFKGKRLDELWSEQKELFGHPSEPVFPLLIKILDAEDDLSVQVHPDDAYGMKHEGELGKTECWYIIDAEPGAEIIYGHHAKTREELAEMIKDGRWDDLLKKVPVKKGDFFYVPSGTIHAIGKGIMILETQQSSDTTYRVYDYDRKDAQGQTRELHIQQSIDVTTVPAKTPELQIKEVRKGNSSIVTYLETEFFNVYEWDIKGITSFKKQAPYTLMTVIEGAGDLVVDGKTYPLEKGTSCIIPNGVSEWAVQGELAIIATEPGK
ncbi:mannose-6-phosphate isomerase, class I [Enterococcus faecium]|uniref:mannose-6-phosphate isomerase, class I n=1 Tax=Enterococcus faecium TaxID=1352 RepID=UPI00187AD65F|nr:mannose-6-phosphate isomerase, class I [Enterococcus faecium]MBE7389467.1 mannose-6-phosphate isomerase, class I [Enterococcus faecium]